MIVDISKDRLVPMVSSPTTSVPKYTVVPGYLHTMLDVGSLLVHDNRVLLFFHSDNLQLMADVKGFIKAYHFSILKEWMEINRLPVTIGKDSSKIVSESYKVIFFILLDSCIVDSYLIDCM
jgi:hypothetical protein